MSLEAASLGGNSRRRSSVSANGTELDPITSSGLRGAGQPGLSSESLCVRARARHPWGAVPLACRCLGNSSDTLRPWEQLGKRSRSPRRRQVEWRWGLWGTWPRLFVFYLRRVTIHHFVSWWPILRSLELFQWMWLLPLLDPKNAAFHSELGHAKEWC